MDTFLAAVALAVLTERLVNALFEPIVAWLATHDKVIPPFVVRYVAWAVGAALSYAAGLNLVSFLPQLSPIAGQVITALAVGGGSNLVHKLFALPAQDSVEVKVHSAPSEAQDPDSQAKQTQVTVTTNQMVEPPK